MPAPTVAVTVSLSSMIGVAVAGATVKVKLDKPDVYGQFIIADEVTATTDVNGECVLDLFPNALPDADPPGLGSSGSAYEVTISNTGGKSVRVRATIPDVDCDLHEMVIADDADTPNYLTATRVLVAVLTGLSTVTATPVTAGDSVLSAFGKLQAMQAYAPGPSTQPTSAYADLVVPEGTFHDNVLTLENRSQDNTAHRANAAIRFRDALTGSERGAMGYTALATDSPGAAFGNLLFAEIGNLTDDAQDTDYAVMITHKPGSHSGMVNDSYKAFEVVGSTGDIHFKSYLGTGSITVYGDVSLGSLRGCEAMRVNTHSHLIPSSYVDVYGADGGGVPVITAGGSLSGIGLALRSKGNGSLFLGGNGLNTLQIDTVASQVNSWQMYGGATGGGVTLTPYGGDTNIDANIYSKNTGTIGLFPNGALGLLISNPNSAVNGLSLVGSATGQATSFGVTGSDTHRSLNIHGAGANGVIALQPTGLGVTTLALLGVASQVNSWLMYGNTTGNGVALTSTGPDTNVDSFFASQGAGSSVYLQAGAVNVLRASATGVAVTGAVSATTSILSSGGALGYAAGAGGTIGQSSSKSTGVTLSKFCGDITLNAEALAGGAIASFVLTNTNILAGDQLDVSHQSGGTIGAYTFNAVCAAGSATIYVRNATAGSLSEAPVLRFSLFRLVTA